MAALPAVPVKQTTLQSTTSTSYGDVSGCTISNANLTAGHDYLLILTSLVGGSAGTVRPALKVIHGSTDFADSEILIAPNANAQYVPYAWWDIWTAVSSEDVKLQMKTNAGTARVDQIVMIAIDLDSLTINSDYFFAERANDDALTTGGTQGANVTLTPAGASNWTVLTHAQLALSSTTVSIGSRLTRVGEATSSTPFALIEGLDVAEVWSVVQMRDFALTASENTFSESSGSDTSDAGTRLHSKILVIQRDLFAQSVAEYTAGGTALSATNYATNLETASISPAVQGDVLILAYTTFDRQNAGREFEVRLQVDDADDPDTQTDDNYQIYGGRDARDQMPMFIATIVEDMPAAAHTIDLDGSSDSTTATPECDDTQIVAFTLELAGGGGGGFVRPPRGLDAGMFAMRGGMQ